MISGSLRRYAAFALVAAVGLTCALDVRAQPSAADIETARTLYQEGKALRDKGDIPGALKKFEAAYSLARTPITGIHLARTYSESGKLVEARETCLSIGRMPVQPEETERSAKARAEAAALAAAIEPRIPAVTIRVTMPDASPATVTIDGEQVPPAALGERRKVNPGRHEVVARASGGREARAQVELREWDHREVQLKLPPPPPSAAPVPPPGQPAPYGQAAAYGQPTPYGAQPEPKKSLPGYALAGFIVAGTGAAVGTVTGLLALAKADDLDSQCPNKQCPPDAHQDLDSGRALGTVSSVAFGVAAIGLTFGVIGVMSTGSKERPATAHVTPWVGAGSAGLKGAF